MIKSSSVPQPGVSIIIPSYRAGESLRRALGSLKNQSLSTEFIEVIVVLNGERAGDEEVSRLVADHPELCLRVFSCATPSASKARNVGLAVASRELVTFLDDDDFLEPRFLETAVDIAGSGRCVLMPIVDQVCNRRDEKNSLNVRIRALAGTETPVHRHPWALGFNACKLVPTNIARRFRYDECLRSGEDLVFFAHLLGEDNLRFVVPRTFENNAYVRQMSGGSVSRQPEGFNFNVRQRVLCVKALRSIPLEGVALSARRSLERAQFGFIQRYLEHFPEDRMKVVECAVSEGLRGFPWQEVRGDRARRLVFSYCFPPYSDTSANVVAKVIREEKSLVDVFYANMSTVRAKDESTTDIVAPYVVHSQEIAVPPSFADWGLISEFGKSAARAAHQRSLNTGGYESMYSRALWSGSHVAAALYKREHPEITWQAEFSDPLTHGADGLPRSGELTGGPVTTSMCDMIANSEWGEIPYDSHFALTELATMIYADELIFTNENQRIVMLEKYPAQFSEFVVQKSTVRHHVVPTPEMYHMVNANYPVDFDRINLAYFGNFYGNRGIGDVISALEALPDGERDKVLLHIFTGNPQSLEEELSMSKARGSVKINSYVKYLEFLNLCAQFDVLIVNDTDTSATGFGINPFLPSKYSDYAGSGALIWGIVEANSPLSELPLGYSSMSGETETSIRVLNQILNQGYDGHAE